MGANGMLGHKVSQVLRSEFDIYVAFQSETPRWARHPLYADLGAARVLYGVDAMDFDSGVHAIERVGPQVVVNCIGIVKQREAAKLSIPSILVNALFPHQLADLCTANGIRLIHLSTDCVFSGKRGGYTESDMPDPIDLYGRTKLLGELDRAGCLTLRTSIIGWELKHRAGLLEWFASQRGQTIKGYRNAIYSGVSTVVLARLIGDLLENNPALSGIYHVASQPIAKYDLLVRLRDALGWYDITIKPDDAFQCDRSLVGARFEAATSWQAPDWDEMIAGLAAEWPTYEGWRSLS